MSQTPTLLSPIQSIRLPSIPYLPVGVIEMLTTFAFLASDYDAPEHFNQY